MVYHSTSTTSQRHEKKELIEPEMRISGVLIPFFPGIGIGIMYTIKELELELPELDPLLESVPLLESAPLLESVPLLESIPRRLWVLGIPKKSKFCPK